MSSEASGFKVFQLDELIERRNQGVNTTTEKVKYSESGIPVIRANNITQGLIDFSDIVFVDAGTFARIKEPCKPKINDILYTNIGSQFGNAAKVTTNFDFTIAWNVLRLQPKTNVDADFLVYLLNNPASKEYIRSLNSSSTMPFVSGTEIGKVQFSVPKLEQQKKIAQALRMLDDRITIHRETNTTLEAIAQALFKSWFVDFDPVRAKQEGREPEGMDADTAALFPDSFEESELGLVPKGWEYCSFQDAVSIFDSKRIPLSGQERAKRQGQYPYYGAATQMDNVDDFLFDGVYFLMGEDGSVADTEGYPITQYVWDRFWVNNHAHILQGKNGISTEHVMLFAKRTNITPYITGAVQAKLSQSNMWRIPFLMPPKPISENFGELIEPLFNRFRHNSDNAQTLTTLRDTLLPRLISGQLRLPDAEALVNGVDFVGAH